MNPTDRLNQAPRCSATSKRSKARCRALAVRGWTVCRCHGAGGGAPPGKRNGRYRHGGRTREAVVFRRASARLLREARDLLKRIPL